MTVRPHSNVTEIGAAFVGPHALNGHTNTNLGAIADKQVAIYDAGTSKYIPINYRLASLDDLNLAGLADQNLLKWDAGTSKWIPTAPPIADVGGLYGINVETLAADKTLTPNTDTIDQHLNPDGSNRKITLDTASASAGNRFRVCNTGTFSAASYLNIYSGASALEQCHAGTIKEYIYDGTAWVAADNGTGRIDNLKKNYAAGFGASGYNYGTAVGYLATAYNSGCAFGNDSSAYTAGVASGFQCSAANYGAASGWNANGSSGGAAMGASANAISSGVSIGRSSNGKVLGVAVGYGAKGPYRSVAVGYSALSGMGTSSIQSNIAVGYQAGNNLTTGTNCILIGYDIDNLTATTDGYMTIGNTIFAVASGGSFGTGTTVSTAKVGILNQAPASALSVAGGIQCADDTDAASADKVGTWRYREDANNSYSEQCVRNGASSYIWKVINQETW